MCPILNKVWDNAPYLIENYFKTPPNIEHKKCLLLTFPCYNEHPTQQYYTKTLQMYNAFL
jgi:hypothetical protein